MKDEKLVMIDIKYTSWLTKVFLFFCTEREKIVEKEGWTTKIIYKRLMGIDYSIYHESALVVE